MINWENIKYLFQIPLEWFKNISDKVFKAYGNNFIVVKDGDYGAMEIDVDPDAFSNAVLEVTGGGSGGGTVKSVDGLAPDAQGNVQIGAIRSINQNIFPDAQGNVNVPTGVATVNGRLPDASGNVEVGNVRSVNSTAPDATGNVDLGTILRGVDHVTAPVEFGILELNAIRSINNRITTDVDHSYNVNGIVTSVNNQTPDAEGNVTLASVGGLVSYGQTLLPGQDGNIVLPNFIKTINGDPPSASDGNIEIPSGVKSVNGVDPDEEGNVELEGLVKSVDGIEPDSQGNVELEGLVKSVDGIEPDSQGNVELEGLVKSVDGVAPDAQGNIALDAVTSVEGLLPDSSGNVSFALLADKWVKTDATGRLTTSTENPIVATAANTGYVKVTDGVVSFEDKEWVDLDSAQTITGIKTFDNRQYFRSKDFPAENLTIDGSSIYMNSPANSSAFINIQTGSTNNTTLMTRTTTNGFSLSDTLRAEFSAGQTNESFLVLRDGNMFLSSSLVEIGVVDNPQQLNAPKIVVDQVSQEIDLIAPQDKAFLATSPSGNVDRAIADVGYVKTKMGDYVTVGGTSTQTVTGPKAFTKNITLSSDTAERDATSRTAESKQIIVRDKDSNIAGLLSYGFNSDGSNQYMMITRKTVNGEAKEASLASYITAAGVTQANIRGEAVNVGPGIQADGRFILRGETGRIQFIPKSGSTTGGTIDFYYGGDTSNYSSRFIEDATALRMVSRAKNITLQASDNTKLILLNTGANNSRLQNAPTIPRTDKTSNAIATCGWVNTNVDAAINNLNLDDFITKDAVDTKLEGYVALTGDQTVGGQKTWQNKQTFNSTAQFNLQAIWGTGNQYTYIDNYQIETPKTVYHNPNAAGVSVGRISGESNVLVVDGDYGVTVSGNDQNVTLAANPNNAVLTNQPTSTDQNSLAIATVGYVQTHCDTVDPDNPPFSGTKKIITGVNWNGTTLTYSSETWTITNGKIMSVTSNADTTIDTPVAY